MNALWTDNGFCSQVAMDQAHDVILCAISKIPFDSGAVLDLGCGNGALLKRIHHEYPQLIPYGIEADSNRQWRAVDDYVLLCDIFNHRTYLTRSFEIALIANNRLLEVQESMADSLLSHLKGHLGHLIVYSYDAWPDARNPLIYRHYTQVDFESSPRAEARIFKPS